MNKNHPDPRLNLRLRAAISAAQSRVNPAPTAETESASPAPVTSIAGSDLGVLRSTYKGPEKLLFSVSHMNKRYGKTVALDDVSLEVYAGQICALIGKNGAGKSTLVESALGLKPFDAGTVTIGGVNVQESPRKAKALLGYSPSEPLAYDSMTGAEYMAYIAALWGMDESVARTKAQQLTEALALPNAMLNKPFALCSHGTQQKVCIAASILHDPAVLILDEPTVGLDIIAYRGLLKILRSYADQGHAVLIVTHDMELVRACSDAIYMLRGEKVFPLDPNREDIATILEETR